MNPASIPVVKAVLPKIEFEAAKEFTREILKLRTERQIYEAILKDYKEKISNHFTGDNKGVVKNG